LHRATFDLQVFCCPGVAQEAGVAKKALKDRSIKALKPAAAGQRYETMDAVTPGLGVRVTDKGKRTFVLVARYPGSPNPTRRALGEFGEISLAQAREKAARWLELLERGVDPREEIERSRLAEQQKRANTFRAVAEDFIAEKLPGERKGGEVERDIRREFLPVWGSRPITELTDLNVLAVINAKKRTAPAQARNLLGTAKRIFGWAIDRRVYGLKTSPAEGLKPGRIIGDKVSGERVLDDAELFALWRAAKRMPYPYGPAYRLLVLTALRLNEAADASRPEFDLANRLWTIPAARMKGRNGKARPHAVPLTADIFALVQTLPQFKKGPYLFSTTFGEGPVWMSAKVKDRLDARMLRTLRALSRRRGDDPRKVVLPAWTNHDIRRTVRSQLSRLKITEEAREAVLAHARPGIKGTYDLYDYLDEKREALEMWAARLRSIVEPPPANIITLSQARA
jgi:integrase